METPLSESATPLLNGKGTHPPALPGGPVGTLLGDPERRDEVRALVETTPQSLASIAERFALPKASFNRAVSALGWSRPPEAPKAPFRRQRKLETRLADTLDDLDLVTLRLLRTVDRQIGKIDRRLRSADTPVDEKDARTLGTLAKTLETLNALDRVRQPRESQAEAGDRAALRAALARRIAAWAEGTDEGG